MSPAWRRLREGGADPKQFMKLISIGSILLIAWQVCLYAFLSSLIWRGDGAIANFVMLAISQWTCGGLAGLFLLAGGVGICRESESRRRRGWLIALLLALLALSIVLGVTFLPGRVPPLVEIGGGV